MTKKTAIQRKKLKREMERTIDEINRIQVFMQHYKTVLDNEFVEDVDENTNAYIDLIAEARYLQERLCNIQHAFLCFINRH